MCETEKILIDFRQINNSSSPKKPVDLNAELKARDESGKNHTNLENALGQQINVSSLFIFIDFF